MMLKLVGSSKTVIISLVLLLHNRWLSHESYIELLSTLLLLPVKCHSNLERTFGMNWPRSDFCYYQKSTALRIARHLWTAARNTILRRESQVHRVFDFFVFLVGAPKFAKFVRLFGNNSKPWRFKKISMDLGKLRGFDQKATDKRDQSTSKWQMVDNLDDHALMTIGTWYRMRCCPSMINDRQLKRYYKHKFLLFK